MEDSFNVDYLLTSINSIEEAVQVRDNVRDILAKAEMSLKKIGANHPSILSGIPEDDLQAKTNSESETIKTL